MKHVSHILRRCILMALVLSLATGIMCVASAAEVGRTDDGVELIAPDVMPLALTPTVKGGRETRNPIGSQMEERVWGWSTLKDAAGGDIYHSTTARYESIITHEPYGSSTKWGYGQVWARSSWIWYQNASSYYARVYCNY